MVNIGYTVCVFIVIDFWTLSSVPLWGVFLPWCTGLVLQLWSAVCLCFGTLGKYNETVVVSLVIVCKSLTLKWDLNFFSPRLPEEQMETALNLLLHPSDLTWISSSFRRSQYELRHFSSHSPRIQWSELLCTFTDCMSAIDSFGSIFSSLKEF